VGQLAVVLQRLHCAFYHSAVRCWSPARILIVDDETAILGLLSATFRTEGYEVSTATSGEQALTICETTSFDAVLSDVTMPGIDGHQNRRANSRRNARRGRGVDVWVPHGLHRGLLRGDKTLHVAAETFST